MKYVSPTKLAAKDKKLREAVLYIADKCQGDETFGATKLNKLLFYADFLAYLNFGKSITGQEYFRLPKGPAPRRWVPVRSQMKRDGDIEIRTADFYGFPQNRVIPLRKADVSCFTPSEIALFDKLIELHRGKTASEISDASHGFIGWILAKDQETIPYEVALVAKRALIKSEVKHGKSLVSAVEAVLKGATNENCCVAT